MSEELLSDYEKLYLIHGAQVTPELVSCGLEFGHSLQDFSSKDGLRLDGRSCTDYRPKQIQINNIKNSYGSCMLTLGNTKVIATIKAEINVPDLNTPNEGKMDFFIECSANAAPEFQGRNGESFSNQIINELSNLFSRNNFNLKQLCIVENRYCWHIDVDLVLLEFGGNVIDACALAVRYALKVAKFPEITIKSDDNGQIELDVSDTNLKNNFMKLDIEDLPYFVSVCKIGHNCIVDPDLKEESITKVKIIFGIDKHGNLRYTSKDGYGSLDPETLYSMADIAKEASKSLNQFFEKN